MSYNTQFEDIMDNINNVAQGYGFVNGRDWAKAALAQHQISYSTFKKYENAHELRVRFSHGNARDIQVSYDTYQTVKMFEQDISNSRLRKRNGGSNNNNHGPNRNNLKMPDGTFRSKPFSKTFHRKGKDGEDYYFKFEIHKETNYLDDGYGGTHGYGYFIHILSAPYLDYALNKLHEFHIIKTPSGCHICWNKIIETFEEANAVMFVWVNRYSELINVLKKDKSISEEKLINSADRKHVLPSGTFRKQGKRKAKKLKTVYITQPVYNQIMSVLGKEKPELGGMLGFTLDQDTIDSYVFDSNAKVDSAAYSPNTKFLQNIIEGEWSSKKIFLGGFVHSHPGDFNMLSFADVNYAQRIIEAFDLEYLFMPIVTSSYQYKPTFNGYIVKLNGIVERCNVKVVPGVQPKEKTTSNKTDETVIDENLLKMVEAGFDSMDQMYLNKNKPSKDSSNCVFATISNVIDIEYMNDLTIIGIGCGGARGFYENMARLGVGNFYLMDGDIISHSNVASQNGYLSEVGKYKTDVIKDRILDINNNAKVQSLNFMLTDDISDEDLVKMFIGNIDLKRSLICAFTDSFKAQARISRIALKYGIPFLSAQHHQHGATSEIIYWYPGISKYSLREITKSRYESYKNGFVNNVTSQGSPVFNTARLNAICEKIGLGLLLYAKYPQHIYCSFLNKQKEKNLLLIKQNYLDSQNGLYELFDNGPKSFFDEIAWINPEMIEDLKEVVLEEGNVGDTRKIFED